MKAHDIGGTLTSETYCVTEVIMNLFQSCHYFEFLGYVFHSQDTFEMKINGTLFTISGDKQEIRRPL